MRKMVVTELEIFDQEKFDKLENKTKVGDIFDTEYHFAVGTQHSVGGIYGMKLEDQTDDNWNNLPREYGILYKNGSRFYYETFNTQYVAELRNEKLMEDSNNKIRLFSKQIPLDKVPNGWNVNIYKNLEELNKDFPDIDDKYFE
jgi:hypothetical protein